jgi:hypothetical protein
MTLQKSKTKDAPADVYNAAAYKKMKKKAVF